MPAEVQLLVNLKNIARNQTYIEIIKQKQIFLLICTSDVVIEDSLYFVYQFELCES